MTSWVENFFTDEERRRWQAQGLAPDDGRLAADLAHGAWHRRTCGCVSMAVARWRRSGVESTVAMVVAEMLKVKRQQQAGDQPPLDMTKPRSPW